MHVWHLRRLELYAQVFCEPNGWTRAFPMAHKSDAHEALSLLFAWDGVPASMVMDNAGEQVDGEFKRKCRQAGCHVRRTEPHTPFSNAAEGSIRELKKATGRDMMKTQSPKVLWDYCLELRAMIRSHTASNVFSLQGEVPETMVSGETTDISQFCEFGWYEWVKFRDTE